MRAGQLQHEGVARAAVDSDFRAELTSSKSCGGSDCELYGHALCVLRESFGYACPWSVKFVVCGDSARAPHLDLAVGSMMPQPFTQEAMTVYIPKKEACADSPGLLLDAIAAYYRQNTWFLRERASDDQPAGAQQVKIDTSETTWRSVASGRNRLSRFDLGDSFDEFVSFGAAMFSAVALAWDNDFFRRQLIADDIHNRRHTIELMGQWLGYTYPWELELIVVEDQNASYNPKTGNWERFTPPQILLTLPRMSGGASIDDEVQRNIASPGVTMIGLSLYNTDGPGYPFTCG